MNELKPPPPRKIHLILILTGTTLLAIPAAIGTFVLFGESSNSFDSGEPIGKALIATSLTGFVIFAGYILTAVFNRHNPVLWFLSLLYNAALSLCYLSFIVVTMASAGWLSPREIYDFATGGGWLLPAWTIYVTYASGYYLKHSLKRNKNILP